MCGFALCMPAAAQLHKSAASSADASACGLGRCVGCAAFGLSAAAVYLVDGAGTSRNSPPLAPRTAFRPCGVQRWGAPRHRFGTGVVAGLRGAKRLLWSWHAAHLDLCIAPVLTRRWYMTHLEHGNRCQTALSFSLDSPSGSLPLLLVGLHDGLLQ